MIDLVRRHEVVHSKITEKLSAYDPAGLKPFGLNVLLEVVGGKLLIDVDILIEELEKGLPETRDALFAVGEQLRAILRMQIPLRRFVGFSAVPRSRLTDQLPNVPKPLLWRRLVRCLFDFLMKRRSIRESPKVTQTTASDPTPPTIRRFPPRSWEVDARKTDTAS